MTLARVALAVGCFVSPLAAVADDGNESAEVDRVVLGRQLFEQNWLRPPADDSPLASPRRGDGLGPMFNGASCVECHRMAGVGGAGPNENNVEIVSLALPLGTPKKTAQRLASRAGAMHPGFLDNLNVFLHRFGRDEHGSLRIYDTYRRRLRDMFTEELLPASQTEQTFGDGLRYQLAQRNTPALFGSGLIDRIEPSLVRQLAAAQRDSHPDVAGRVTDSGAGRFGWRGHMSSLEQFVRTACAEELGMQVRKIRSKGVQAQPTWPVDGPRTNDETDMAIDLSEKQVQALVAYVRSLPAPRQVLPQSFEDRVVIDSGRRRFEDAGCAVCHTPDVGPAKGLFSDLLLHRMGPVFADRVAAPFPQPRVVRQVGVIRGGGAGGGSYAGGGGSIRTTSQIVEIPPSLGELEAATEEFRTPPLWGVADSAPYLHDGRAETLDDAIRLHDGQAKASAQKYESLDDEARGEVLAFLETLRAPIEE
jgi:CxxC motif-containing protein (DUF1111 family)